MSENRNFSKFFVIFVFSISFLFFASAIVLLITYFNLKKDDITPEQLYSESLNNVIEVKASTTDVGETFGSGVIIDKDGTIVTNAHVVTYTYHGSVNEFEEIKIRFAFEDEYRAAKLIKYDNDLDLAVIKLNNLPDFELQPIKLGNSDELKSGSKVYAIGNASNNSIGIFEGIVSIPLINIELDGLMRSVIQCDITVASGNSGGALINDGGELVGITTFRTKDITGNVIYGIAYCVPVNIIIQFVK